MTTQDSKNQSARTRRSKSKATSATQPPEAPNPVTRPADASRGHRGKLGLILALLGRPEGASVPDMMEATGWQAHSVRGVISGTLKKKFGLVVQSTKGAGGERLYRIQAEAADDAA